MYMQIDKTWHHIASGGIQYLNVLLSLQNFCDLFPGSQFFDILSVYQNIIDLIRSGKRIQYMPVLNPCFHSVFSFLIFYRFPVLFHSILILP